MLNSKFQFILGVIVIWLSHLFLDFMLGVWPVYKTLVTLDLVVAGLIASFGTFIGEGLQLYFGILSDRGFHQRLLTLGIGLTLATPFLVYIHHPLALFICVLCTFVGSGAFHPAGAGLLVTWKPSQKNILIALFASGGMVGAACSQYTYMKVYQYFEGHTWILAIPILIFTICCYFFKFPQLHNPLPKVDIKQMFDVIKPLRFELSLLYIAELCLQIVVLSFSFLLPEILLIKGGEKWLCMGGGYFYFILGSVLTSVPIGYCLNKWGYKLVLAAITVMSALLLYSFLGLQSLSVFPTILFLMLIGGTMGVVVPVVVAGANSLVPSYASSFISALYMGGASCLAGFGPIVASLIATYLVGGEMAPVKTLQLLSSLLIVALGVIYFLPESSAEEEMVEIRS